MFYINVILIGVSAIVGILNVRAKLIIRRYRREHTQRTMELIQEYIKTASAIYVELVECEESEYFDIRFEPNETSQHTYYLILSKRHPLVVWIKQTYAIAPDGAIKIRKQ